MNNAEEYQNDNNKNNWLFLAAALIIGSISANFSHLIFLVFTSFTKTIVIVESILRIIGTIAFAIIIALELPSQFNIIKKEGVKLKNASIIISILLLTVVMSSLNFMKVGKYGEITLYFESTTTESKKKLLDKMNDSNISAEKKSIASQMYAQMIYEEEGNIIEYLTPKGAKTVYVPSKEAQNNHAKLSGIRYYFHLQNKINMTVGFLWIIITMGAVLMSIKSIQSKSTEQAPP